MVFSFTIPNVRFIGVNEKEIYWLLTRTGSGVNISFSLPVLGPIILSNYSHIPDYVHVNKIEKVYNL